MFNMCIRTQKHTHSELTRWSTHVQRNDMPSARAHKAIQRQRWCDGCKIFLNIYYNLFDIYLSAWTRRNRCGERPKLTKCALITEYCHFDNIFSHLIESTRDPETFDSVSYQSTENATNQKLQSVEVPYLTANSLHLEVVCVQLDSSRNEPTDKIIENVRKMYWFYKVADVMQPKLKRYVPRARWPLEYTF